MLELLQVIRVARDARERQIRSCGIDVSRPRLPLLVRMKPGSLLRVRVHAARLRIVLEFFLRRFEILRALLPQILQLLERRVALIGSRAPLQTIISGIGNRLAVRAKRRL